MPNSNQKNDFYTFVLTYFRNDPYMMLDRFEADIAKVASEVSIDWYQTKRNVDLDGVRISGKLAKGMTSNDSGRIWVIAHECDYETNYAEALIKLSENGCPWLKPSKEKLNKIIILQRYFKKTIMINLLMKQLNDITEVYYQPGNKGFYLLKEKFDN